MESFSTADVEKKKQKIFEFFSLTLEDFVVETAAIAC